MKYIKFLMALAVACVLIMPAFSMPYDTQNGKQNQWNDQKPMMQDGKENQCNCQNSMGQDNNQCGCQKSMMGNDGNQNKFDGKQNDQCGCQNSMGKDNKQMFNRPVESMMGKMNKHNGKQMCHKPIESMMGKMNKHNGIKAVIVSVKIIE